MSEPPVVASYCTTFLKREMAHIYRQVTGLRDVRTFVMTKTRLNAERYPFDDVELVGKPTKNFLRRFYLKYVRRAEAVVYRGEFQVLDGILSRRGAQLMHIYFGHTGVHLLPFIKAWDKPCVVSFHGADISMREHQPGYESQMREMLRTVPLVLARSQSLRDRLLQLGCPPDRLALNRTGVPLEQFPYVPRTAPANGGWRIVQACRLIPKKGLVTSLQAFAKFRERYPNANFVIAGDGPMLDDLKSRVAKLGLEKCVQFPGFLNQAKLYELYVSSHVFIHPSELMADANQEGIPNSMLEAMSTGLPVVATFHGGIPEAVDDGVTGFLVPEKDPAAVCGALCRVVESVDAWARMGREASDNIMANFEQRAQIEHLERLYRRVLDRHAEESAPKSASVVAAHG
jgi:colanic acid/amylovoran biosynthesis glycosyltransferase